MSNLNKQFPKKGFMLILIISLLWQNGTATNVMKIGTYSVQPSTEFTVSIEVDNSSPFVAFQVDIPIPEGFKYIDSSAQLIADRISGHALSASFLSGNILRLIGYSVNNTAFIGTTGALLSFTLKSGSIPANYILELKQPLLSDSQSVNILTSFVNGSVTILAPNLKLSASELNYGRVPLQSSAPQTFQIKNEGNRDLIINNLSFNDTQFSNLDATPFTISANNSRSISVKFSPTIKGTYSKQLQISSNDPDQANSTLVLNAIAFAVNEIHTGNIIGASSSSGTLDFSLNNMEEFTGLQFDLTLPEPMSYLEGSAKLYRAVDHRVNVSQLNSQTLRVIVFSAGNKNFTGAEGKILSLDFMLNGVAGWYSIGINNVVIANKAVENIVSASYGGSLQITSPDIDANTLLTFGDVSILSSLTKMHRIFNYGQEPLVITQIIFSNGYFSSSQNLPISISPNSFLDLAVKFKKSVKGSATASLKIISNDPDENPFTIQLSGIAFAPNYLLINTQEYTQGDKKNLSIDVENEEEFVALQFDLNFPLGFSPDLNSIVLTNRKQDHVLAVVGLSTTSLRLLAYSPGGKAFIGKAGAVLNIPFEAGLSIAPGEYNLTFNNSVLSNSKSENILYSTKNGVLTIKKFNTTPLANAGVNQVVNERAVVTLDGSFSSDADGDNITYLWTAPNGITLSSNTVAKPTFTAPEVSTDTEYTFSLVVNDGIESSSADQVVITVKQVNKAPVANAGADKSVLENTLCTLDGSASSDADNDALTYLWTAPSGIILSSTTVAKPTFTAPEVSTDTEYTFSLVVNDGELYSEIDNVIITIQNVTNVGITDVEKKIINIYPNPVSNELLIEIKGNTHTLNFEIINSIGQIVYKGLLIEKTSVKTIHFLPGSYFVIFDRGNNYKFVKL